MVRFAFSVGMVFVEAILQTSSFTDLGFTDRPKWVESPNEVINLQRRQNDQYHIYVVSFEKTYC